MDKQQLLSEIRQMAVSGNLTQSEVLAEFGNLQTKPETEAMQASGVKLSEIMYYIGGAIIFVGISVMCYQNWDHFSGLLRILVSLGSFIASFLVGTLLFSREDFKKVSQAFFLLAGLLAPVGLNVFFKELTIDISSDTIQLLLYGILTSIFLGSLVYYKQTVLLFFGVLFATGFFHFIINLIIGQNLLAEHYATIWEYRLLAAGLAWIFLGYYLNTTAYKAITGTLYGFGIFTVLTTTIFLGGFSPDQNVFWELVYPLIVFGAIFASVYLKSKSFLVFGFMFLIIYILKLTGEYFTSGLGWPLALVLAGLAVMAVGYWAVKLNKKYFSHTI